MKKYIILVIIGFIIYTLLVNSSIFSESKVTMGGYDLEQDYRLDEGGPWIVYVVETKLKDKDGSVVFSCVDFVDPTESALQEGKGSGVAKATEYLLSIDK